MRGFVAAPHPIDRRTRRAAARTLRRAAPAPPRGAGSRASGPRHRTPRRRGGPGGSPGGTRTRGAAGSATFPVKRSACAEAVERSAVARRFRTMSRASRAAGRPRPTRGPPARCPARCRCGSPGRTGGRGGSLRACAGASWAGGGEQARVIGRRATAWSAPWPPCRRLPAVRCPDPSGTVRTAASPPPAPRAGATGRHGPAGQGAHRHDAEQVRAGPVPAPPRCVVRPVRSAAAAGQLPGGGSTPMARAAFRASPRRTGSGTRHGLAKRHVRGQREVGDAHGVVTPLPASMRRPSAARCGPHPAGQRADGAEASTMPRM